MIVFPYLSELAEDYPKGGEQIVTTVFVPGGENEGTKKSTGNAQ